jgi:y4mF family transcriptional regulator
MRVETTRDVGGLIREARRARGMTQEDLADSAGVTRRWLTDIERGIKARAELGLVLATLSTLGVELEATYPGGPVRPASWPATEQAELPDHGVDLDEALDHYEG